MGKTKAPDDALEGEVLTAEEEEMLRQAMVTQEQSAAILPMFYSRALIALQEADRLDECQDYIHKAEMIGVYAKQAKDDRMLVMAKRINARAWRRLGELLRALPVKRAGGGGRRMVADQWAESLLNVLASVDQFLHCPELAKRVGIDEGGAKRVLTMLVNAGYLESATGPGGGYRLARGVEIGKIRPDDIRKAVSATEEQRAERRVPGQIPRELTRRGQAEQQGLSKGEQTKATRIASIPDDIFHQIVESDRSASGYQLLTLERNLKGSNNAAYGMGGGSMRRVIERELREFRMFTEVAPVRAVSLLFAADASSMRVKVRNLIAWCDEFSAALRARG